MDISVLLTRLFFYVSITKDLQFGPAIPRFYGDRLEHNVEPDRRARAKSREQDSLRWGSKSINKGHKGLKPELQGHQQRPCCFAMTQQNGLVLVLLLDHAMACPASVTGSSRNILKQSNLTMCLMWRSTNGGADGAGITSSGPLWVRVCDRFLCRPLKCTRTNHIQVSERKNPHRCYVRPNFHGGEALV